MTEKTETDKEMTENADANADEMTVRNKRVATESDMKTEERDRQIVTVTAAEAVTAAATETNIETERVTDFRSKKNIRLLAAT